jgi:hypothetical protein
MTDEPLIVRVVASGPLLGSRTVTPAWFISAADVTAAWDTARQNSRISRQNRRYGVFGAERHRSRLNGQSGRTGRLSAKGVRDDD